MAEATRTRADSPTKTCTEPGCDRALRARGLCATHYNRAKYPAEQRHPKVTVPCDWCEKPCQKEVGRGKRYGRLFCSLACRDSRRADNDGANLCPVPESHAAHPRWIGRLLPALYVRPAAEPAKPRVIRWVAGNCDRCGSPYVAEDYTDRARYCSHRCGKADGKDRRRARKRAAYVADVHRLRVFERDGWRCQLCRRKVDRTKVVPHPHAPVLDHVLPLSQGGTHEPANVQCAHYMCNSVKSDGVFGAGEQLLLIG